MYIRGVILEPRAGFEPATSALPRLAIDWQGFKAWLEANYRKKSMASRWCYANQYYEYIFNKPLSELMILTRDKRQHIMKALISLSKFLGLYPQFKQRLQSYGLKWDQRTALETFNSIMNKNKEDVYAWVKEVIAKNPTLEHFMQFAKLSGLRKEESIQAFNLIIELSNANRLNDYFNESTSCLEHFRFPKLFIRHTKNAYISFIPKELLLEIAKKNKITYETIRKRLERQGFKIKLGLLRSAWATFMQRHLTQAEVDVLQGRINQSVFMQHYFSPNILELKQRTLTALKELL